MATTPLDLIARRARAERLHGLCDECVGSDASEQADRIRDAMRMLGGSGVAGTGALDVAAVEALLAGQASVEAVLALLGPQSAFMLSRGANGTCLASVVHPGSADDVTAQGVTPALALLAAHISAVLSRLKRTASVPEAALQRMPARLH